MGWRGTRDRWRDQVGKRKRVRWRKKGNYWGERERDSEGSERKCGGMRMDRLKGGGRLNWRVVFDRGITA